MRLPCYDPSAWYLDIQELRWIAEEVYGVNIAELLTMCQRDGACWLWWGRATKEAYRNKPQIVSYD